MVIELKQHIEVIGDNPLAACLANTRLKAYIIAQMAFIDGAENIAESYDISIGAVYAAMSFYEDNRGLIERTLRDNDQALKDMGAIDGDDAIDSIKQRLKK